MVIMVDKRNDQNQYKLTSPLKNSDLNTYATKDF